MPERRGKGVPTQKPRWQGCVCGGPLLVTLPGFCFAFVRLSAGLVSFACDG